MSTILDMAVEAVPVGDLTPYPGNARRGDLRAICDSLQANGQYRPLVAQRSTGYVLCGNNTLAAAARLGWERLAVQYLDVDDAAARRILLADNRTNDGAEYDEILLARLLEGVDDLAGTGFTDEEADDLLAALEEEAPAPLAPAPAPAEQSQPLAPEGGAPGAEPSDGEPQGASGRLTAGQRLDDNTTWAPSITEKRENYKTSLSRQLVLTYHGADYIAVVESLERLSRKYGTGNNSDTVRAALADAESAEGGHNQEEAA